MNNDFFESMSVNYSFDGEDGTGHVSLNKRFDTMSMEAVEEFLESFLTSVFTYPIYVKLDNDSTLKKGSDR